MTSDKPHQGPPGSPTEGTEGFFYIDVSRACACTWIAENPSVPSVTNSGDWITAWCDTPAEAAHVRLIAEFLAADVVPVAAVVQYVADHGIGDRLCMSYLHDYFRVRRGYVSAYHFRVVMP